jgi:hypothetical protein
VFRNESGFYHSFVSLELSPAGISNASTVKGVFAPKALSRGDGPISTHELTVWTGALGPDAALEVGESPSDGRGTGEVPPALEGGCPCHLRRTPSRRFASSLFVVSSPR